MAISNLVQFSLVFKCLVNVEFVFLRKRGFILWIFQALFSPCRKIVIRACYLERN